MKRLVSLLLVITAALAGARADDETLPPKDLRGEWSELQKLGFANWTIKDFLGWDVPFDGGSKVFFFESDGGERFDLSRS